MNSVCVAQITSLLPKWEASESEHFTSTTVPGTTGNCVVVSIVLIHSVFSPVHGSVRIYQLISLLCCMTVCYLMSERANICVHFLGADCEKTCTRHN